MKVLLFANTDWYLYNFRLRLAEDLKQKGYEVVFLSPPGEYGPRLEAAGFRWLQLELSRRGMNPLVEFGTIRRLISIYRQERPDLVNHFTIKCVLYGSLAARLCRISSIVNAITGLGYVFTGSSWYAGLLLAMVKGWYRFLLSGTQVIFENSDNLALFVNKSLIKPENANLVRSAGVDIAHYRPSEEPEGSPVVMLASRMLWDKGVGVFVEAARILRQEGVGADFVLVGDTYPDNPSAIPREQLVAWHEQGIISWWGWKDDMPSIFQKANLVCLPSHYPEGVPTVVLEASASQRAVITTDAPGCRDAVIPGVTGLLVPVRDPAALAKAMRRLIDDPELRRSMGRAGRELVEREFSSQQVTAGTLAVYQKAGRKGNHA